MTKRSFPGPFERRRVENMQDSAHQGQALLELARAMRNTAARCQIWATRHPHQAGDYRALAQELIESAAEIEAHSTGSVAVKGRM